MNDSHLDHHANNVYSQRDLTLYFTECFNLEKLINSKSIDLLEEEMILNNDCNIEDAHEDAINALKEQNETDIDDLEDKFKELIDFQHKDFQIFDMSYTASEILKEMNSNLYKQHFDNYIENLLRDKIIIKIKSIYYFL